jgi:regulator of sigma E protease
MEIGPIESIQKNSPGAQAGMKVGDVFKSVNGKDVVDPLALPNTIRRLAGQEITIGVLRDGKPLEITLTPRQPRMYAGYGTSGSLLGIESIGVALPVLNRVQDVFPGSPAAKAGMQQGDELVSAQFVPPNEEQQEEEKKQIGLRHKEIELGKYRNWLQVHEWMQAIFPGTKLKLEYRRGEETKEALLLPETRGEFNAASDAPSSSVSGGAPPIDDLYVVDRGFRLESMSEEHVAQSWGEAFSLGLRNTGESLMMVFRFLRKLVTNQISPTNLGGPIAIFAVAGHEANAGISRLLLFLTLLSANLAIINFLPIPVLDGGHMLFLLYEGIFGKPVNELWAMRLTVAGLVFILTLMVFVIGLDIYRFTSLLLS